MAGVRITLYLCVISLVAMVTVARGVFKDTVAMDAVAMETVAKSSVPMVVNTWGFTGATDAAWQFLESSPSDGVGAVVAGCTNCELEECATSVGFGGSPDENGETTLDAMIMDGVTHDVGSVAALRRVKNAIGVAHAVMKYTTHTLLVGDQATDFAIEMGFTEESLQTNRSREQWENWETNNCQPNYRRDVTPDPSTSCGPYSPSGLKRKNRTSKPRLNPDINKNNHDTIGMIVVDGNSNVASGTSTNGATHKVPGRVGDSPVTGAGSYADNDVGGCAATGDGDVMMRFLPCYQAVEDMRLGSDVTSACESALQRIVRYYPNFSGALVAVNKTGQHGAACHGFGSFPYSVRNGEMNSTTVFSVTCF